MTLMSCGDKTNSNTISQLKVSPTILNFSGKVGQAIATKTVKLSNTGTASISFSISSKPSWLTVDPSNGSINPGANQIITIGATNCTSAGSEAKAVGFKDGALTTILKVSRTCTDKNTIVNIPDANLAKAIRKELGLQTNQAITKTDMEKLKSLNAGKSFTQTPDSEKIKNLEGLQYAVNLGVLSIYNNLVSDLSVLSDVTNLFFIDISRNQISNITALSNLTNLTWLDLRNNDVIDISSLSGMKNMTKLYLGFNEISNITALSSLNNLTVLNLESNQISNIAALSSLSNLTVLNLESNQISNIAALSNLTNLKHLIIDRNQISDISALSSMTGLTGLGLGNNQISDISALSSLTNLDHLDLFYNQKINDITSLSGLTKLKYLDLKENKISDITALVNNPGLTGKDDEIALSHNCLDLDSGEDLSNINILKSRGIVVGYRPQKAKTSCS